MSLPQITIEARKGASADIALRIETSVKKFVAISAMTNTAPMQVTATAHNVPDQWAVAIIDATGLTELNAVDPNDIQDDEFHEVTVIDADTLEFNGISAASFGVYATAGHIVYFLPLDLSVYTGARMDIKRKVGGAVELALDTASGTLDIDAPTNTLFIRLDATALDALSVREYVFDIELIRSSGVDAICSAESVFEVLPEITTSP